MYGESSIVFSMLGLLVFILYVVVSWISKNHRNSKGKRAPVPEAGGAWPVIGHLHLLGGPESPHLTLANMADKYGPIFGIRLGVHPCLIISNWEMAKECFIVNDRALASRPKLLAFEIMGYDFAMIGFSPYGNLWRHVRKMATLEVLSNHRLESLKHVKESEVKWAMKETYEWWLKSKSGRCEMKKWFGDIALNVVFRMVVGRRFEEIEGKERLRKTLRDFFDLSGSFTVSDALPFLRWLDLDGKEKAMNKTFKELDQNARLWLEQHKTNRDCQSPRQTKAKHGDFIDVLLSIVDQDQLTDAHDADTIIKATSLALILAGTDTSTVTLIWCLCLLMNNPQVLEKAVEEVDREIGKERMAEESDLKKLPYLQAILKETMRLYPAAPLAVPHESMEDCTIGGYHIPSGTRLFVNLSKLHRDPKVYPDPLEFRPERFLTTHKDVDVRGHNFELIPFGAGRRMCPGISFALQIMQLTLANLLHAFDITNPDNQAVDMQEQTGLTNIKASPLQLLLTPRLSPHLYK
ncbi:cytochrome P450 CYP82D47-like [Senna tora]|uniref:Cytochrome P450 CYP82D47-like n=1 Tax=Senna tora TaxID=362788 RepID=A0A834T9C9_9FABA|nr:cytochrome P450 CYP82D47-like [Senna tora]